MPFSNTKVISLSMWRCIRSTYPEHKIKRMVSWYIRNIATSYRNFLCDDPAIEVMKMKVKIRVSNYFKYGLGSSNPNYQENIIIC